VKAKRVIIFVLLLVVFLIPMVLVGTYLGMFLMIFLTIPRSLDFQQISIFAESLVYLTVLIGFPILLYKKIVNKNDFGNPAEINNIPTADQNKGVGINENRIYLIEFFVFGVVSFILFVLYIALYFLSCWAAWGCTQNNGFVFLLKLLGFFFIILLLVMGLEHYIFKFLNEKSKNETTE
jgi:hypothetical protein